jgi:hypothetical protein
MFRPSPVAHDLHKEADFLSQVHSITEEEGSNLQREYTGEGSAIYPAVSSLALIVAKERSGWMSFLVLE